MAAWQRVFVSTVILNALPGTNAETVVGQVQISDASPDSVVALDAWARITTGASTTFIVPRIRRGGVAGTQVGDATSLVIIGAVGSSADYAMHATDQPGEVASQLYSFTISQTAVTVAGTLISVWVRAVI